MSKEILYRCKYEENFIARKRSFEKWVFICGTCLPHIKQKFIESYQYGGTWKSLKK